MNVSDQRLAVARLTTYCEIIITRGLLPMDKETALRALVNSTCNAFDMASVAEQENTSERRSPLPSHHMSLNHALRDTIDNEPACPR